MRLYMLVIGSSVGMIMSGFLTSFLLMPPLASHDEANQQHQNVFPVPAESVHLIQTGESNKTALSQCLTWEPKQHNQVLLIAFHPEKTAGSSMSRFLEIQEKENGGTFEMMNPWDETWLFQWLGDADFRALHPRVFCHLHGKGSFFAKRAFRRESMLATAKSMSEDIQNVVQADSVDSFATGFFEYLVKLLAMHAPRLEKHGARVLAIPSWREPGQHFVSGLMFLEYTHKKFRGDNRLGVMGHARHALNSLATGERAKHEYYKPEVLLLYYYGLHSPIVSALHNVTQVGDLALELSQVADTNATKTLTEKTTSTMSFMEAYRHIYNFVQETRNVTLWAVSEQLDQSFLMLAHEAGFRLYEEETCLPLWDTVRKNTNPLRKRDSLEESIVAGIGRTVVSPGASTIQPLILEAHDAWWTRDATKLNEHIATFSQARNRFAAEGVPKEIQAKREKYKIFLQMERFPRPTVIKKKVRPK